MLNNLHCFETNVPTPFKFFSLKVYKLYDNRKSTESFLLEHTPIRAMEPSGLGVATSDKKATEVSQLCMNLDLLLLQRLPVAH